MRSNDRFRPKAGKSRCLFKHLRNFAHQNGSGFWIKGTGNSGWTKVLAHGDSS
jgi:hypothetical protein